jgi:hypothetical protein
MGGILVITVDQEIVTLSLDEDVTRRETEQPWRLLALAIAARLYTELAHLVPPRPPTARSCEQCGGTCVFLGSYCGVCHHLGWVTT